MTKSEMEFHVSPDGNDSWSGRLAAPNADRTDGPLRTIEAAQVAVRRRKAALQEPVELRVWIHGGVYELQQPLLFTAQDSGFPRQQNTRARTWPVTWAAVPGEEPVISGGRRITGVWRQEYVNARKVWVTEIPEVAAGRWLFRQIWVNGQRRLRPRLPKQGVWQVERALDARFTGAWSETFRQGSCRFGFAPGQIRSDWRNLRDVEVQFFAWWIAPRARMTTVDDEARIAWFDRYSTIRLAWGEGDGVDFRLENVFEALSEPGEWYLDRHTGKLYYIPMPGEDMAASEIIAPRLESLLRIDGAANLRFEGLSFAHNEWREPAGFADSNQASHEVPGALILHNADTCVFSGCRVLHNNTYAVEIDRGTIEASLERCELRDMGAGGVRIWHGCRRNVVSDCEIADGGHVYPAGVGVLIGRSSGNRIEHNHIHDLYYTGISAGWNWGYAESDGYGNLLEWNHIHDIGKGLLSDMGGIYLLGHASGTRLRFNHIHDIVCRRYGGWCAYTDEGSTDVLIESNLCYNANKDVFHQHYGRNNVVRNNILAYGGESVLAYSAQEEHLGVTFESNIMLCHDKPILRNVSPERWTPRQTAFHRNLYWCETGAVEFLGNNTGVYGSQPFPSGYRAESSRFAALGEVPTVKGTPREADWKRAKVLTRFVTQAGVAEAPAGTGGLRLLLEGDALHVRGTFKRPAKHKVLRGALWDREHVELFLKPFVDRPGMVQIHLASDGEMLVMWHDSEAPAGFSCETKAEEIPGGWQATLRIPLAPILAAAGGSGMPAWRFFAGFSVPVSADGTEWSSWQRGHDAEGVMADPLFVDPQHGDFRLRPDSPALALGFVPFDVLQCGPRMRR
jgi:hypothetical protein